jgi:hypothetical protein
VVEVGCRDAGGRTVDLDSGTPSLNQEAFLHVMVLRPSVCRRSTESWKIGVPLLKASDYVSILSLFVSVLALGASLYASAKSVQAARAGLALSSVKDLLSRHHDRDFYEARKILKDSTFTEDLDISLGLDGMPREKRDAAHKVASLFEELGRLIAHRIISEDIIIGAYGGAILKSWEVLAPLIYAQRSVRSSAYYVYFEDLAARSQANSASDIYRRIGLRQLPPD